MSDLISREEAIKINKSHHGEMPNHINHQIWNELIELPPADIMECAKAIKEWLETLPIVEDRPKGEWDTNCQGIVFCSHCKKVFNHNYDIDYMESHFKFCPNCGADMRGTNE